MPTCIRCGKDTADPKTTACFNDHIEFGDGAVLLRIPHSGEDRCLVCNVMSGSVHHKDCYMERCPKCGKRLVSCACLIPDKTVGDVSI